MSEVELSSTQARPGMAHPTGIVAAVTDPGVSRVPGSGRVFIQLGCKDMHLAECDARFWRIRTIHWRCPSAKDLHGYMLESLPRGSKVLAALYVDGANGYIGRLSVGEGGEAERHWMEIIVDMGQVKCLCWSGPVNQDLLRQCVVSPQPFDPSECWDEDGRGEHDCKGPSLLRLQETMLGELPPSSGRVFDACGTKIVCADQRRVRRSGRVRLARHW
jgi:hypothetical protein